MHSAVRVRKAEIEDSFFDDEEGSREGREREWFGLTKGETLLVDDKGEREGAKFECAVNQESNSWDHQVEC